MVGSNVTISGTDVSGVVAVLGPGAFTSGISFRAES